MAILVFFKSIFLQPIVTQMDGLKTGCPQAHQRKFSMKYSNNNKVQWNFFYNLLCSSEAYTFKKSKCQLYVTRSPSVDLDFFENLNFHVLMFLMVYKHVFTQVRLGSSKKSMLNITHRALMLIWILLEYRVNSAKKHVFGPFPPFLHLEILFLHDFTSRRHVSTWWNTSSPRFIKILEVRIQTRGGHH